ncbi:uncharacterized protein LODBEIA_P16460 [Lodderomyces beijingensis]|uniref:Uncharacterized protein n=1 Tax=Lodderomyces beijingensis TaxID=1775926 RepID=A0ABP0ZGX6_9ASCO
MDDTDRPDPILKQVPLIKNPSYQQPKAITLNANYNKLLPTLSATAIPPKLKINGDELNSWSEKLTSEIVKIETEAEKSQVYEAWIKEQTTKVAPGFDFNVMTPQRTGR